MEIEELQKSEVCEECDEDIILEYHSHNCIAPKQEFWLGDFPIEPMDYFEEIAEKLRNSRDCSTISIGLARSNNYGTH